MKTRIKTNLIDLFPGGLPDYYGCATVFRHYAIVNPKSDF